MYRYRMLKSITEDDRKNMLQGIERNETLINFMVRKMKTRKVREEKIRGVRK